MNTAEYHQRTSGGPLRALCAVFVLCSLATEASAGTEEGVTAFKNGDYERALAELRPAAEGGDAKAQYYLGGMYWQGRQVDKDLQKARLWLRRSLDNGYVEAARELGNLYSHGLGVEGDNKEAAELYRKAAKAGDPVAQRNLGLMYEEGEGVEYNATKAARWFRRAAEQDDPVALTHLGQLTWMGQGKVSRDRGHALELLHRAARQDHAHAQYLYCSNMTEVYGQGSDALVKAFKWCKLASDQGYPGGENMWEAAERWFLSPEQKRRAAELAAEWSAAHR